MKIDMKSNLEKLSTTILISFFFIVLLACYIRIYIGVYFTDESFYIAIPYRFILGNIPLKDEYSICQFAGVLLYPFYYLYLLLHHSTDAIVIFSRHLYFAFFTLLSGFCYYTFKNELGWRLAILTAIYCLAFNFCNIALLSYNTLATFFLTCGCLCNYQIYKQHSKISFYFIASGFCFSAASFVYPPLIIVAFISYLILSLRDWQKSVVSFTVGAIPLLLLSVILIYHAGLPALFNTYHYLVDTGYTQRSSNSIYSLWELWKIYTSGKGIVLSLLGIFCLASLLQYAFKFSTKINKDLLLLCEKIIIYSTLLIPIILIAAYLQQLIHRYEHVLGWDFVTDCYTLLINLCFLAPIYLKILPDKPCFKNLLISIWLPSLIAGLTTGFFSKNGLPNIIVGLFPALIVSSIMIGQAYKEFCLSAGNKGYIVKLANLFPYLIVVVLLLILLINKYTFNYQDPPIYQLTQQINQGPFKYLFTANIQKTIDQQYAQDINQMQYLYKPNSILIYPGFSAGYLYSNLLPMTNSVWLFDLTDKVTSTTLSYLNERKEDPDIVVIMKNDIHNSNDALVNFVKTSNYELIKSRDGYLIYIANTIKIRSPAREANENINLN